jgi:hypothetical protein
MSVWNAIDSDLEILRHEDCLGALGFFEALKEEGLKEDASITAEHRKRFYETPKGRIAQHLVVRNNLSKTVSKAVLKGFNNVFQEGVKVTGALLTSESAEKELKRKFEDREFQPGKDMVEKNLLVDALFWYRARQLRQRRSDLTHKEIFATVSGEMSVLKEDMQKFVDFTIQASMMSFAKFLENSGYRGVDATAIKVNIVTLHSQLGVIIDPEEDAEMIRENDNKVQKEKKTYFDPSYM